MADVKFGTLDLFSYVFIIILFGDIPVSHSTGNDFYSASLIFFKKFNEHSSMLILIFTYSYSLTRQVSRVCHTYRQIKKSLPRNNLIEVIITIHLVCGILKTFSLLRPCHRHGSDINTIFPNARLMVRKDLRFADSDLFNVKSHSLQLYDAKG